MNTDEQFNEIIQEALTKASRVRCSASEYREQLREWISEIRTAIQANEDTVGDDDAA